MIHFIKPIKGSTWSQVDSNLIEESFGWDKNSDFGSWVRTAEHEIKLMGLDFDYIKQNENLNRCMLMDYKIVNDGSTVYEGYLDLNGKFDNEGRLFTGKAIKMDKFAYLNDDKKNLFDHDANRYSLRTYFGTLKFYEYEKVMAPYGETITGVVKHEWENCALVYHEEGWYRENDGLGDFYEVEYVKKIWVREEYYTGGAAPSGNWYLFDPDPVGADGYGRLPSVTRLSDRVDTQGQQSYAYIRRWSYVPDLTYRNGVKLSDVLASILDDEGETLYSEFFGNDTTTVSNDVYDLDLFSDIYLYQLSDIINPNADSPATKMEVELRKFVQEIIKYFNLEMWKDTNVYLEHKSWNTRDVNLDITNEPEYEHKYEYKAREVGQEEWIHAEGGVNANFKNVRIRYDKSCAIDQERSEKAENFEILYTDLYGILSGALNTEDVELNRVVMVLGDGSGVIHRADTLLQDSVINGGLSFYYLVNVLYNYDRERKHGWVDTTAIINKITGSGKEYDIEILMTKEEFFQLSPYDIVKTPNGACKILDFKWKNNKASLKLEYI